MASVPGRIKDFHRHAASQLLPVAAYLSDHEDGTPFEIQIRTEEMHKMAEEGFASALEIQRRPGLRAGRAAASMAASGGGVAARRQ